LKILDIGCGHGGLHPFLKPIDASITGIDMAAEVLKVAEQQNPDVTYVPFDGGNIPFDAGSFDAALMVCVMHHVPPSEWHRLLVETKRVLSPSGSLTIFEHNPLNPLTQLVVRSNVIDKDAVLLRRGHLIEMMRAADFAEVTSQYILLTPFEKSWARRLETTMKNMPLGAQYFVTGRVDASSQFSERARQAS
jgi:SAM-dependent methyltransferase